MPQPPETRESTKHTANLFMQRFAPRSKIPRGAGVAVTFWSGEVTDVSELEFSRIIEVDISGERKFVQCSWPAGIVQAGDHVEGRVDEVGQYWVIALINDSLSHLHEYSDPMGGTPDGANTLFSTTFAYDTDQITVHLNGQALRRSEYTQVDNRYVDLLVAPRFDADLDADYRLQYPSATPGDGSYIIAADREDGWVVRCQNCFAAAPSWENISQGVLGAVDDVADVVVPPWAPAGIALLCGASGVWRTNNYFNANPALVRWTQVLTPAEIYAQTVPSPTSVAIWELAADEVNETVYLAVAIQDFGIAEGTWVFRSTNLGASWTPSNQIVTLGYAAYGLALAVNRLETGAGGNVYVNPFLPGAPAVGQRDYVYRSTNQGVTFAQAATIVEPGVAAGSGLVIHKLQAADTEMVCITWGEGIADYVTDGTFNFLAAAGMPNPPFQMRGVQYDPQRADRLFAACDSGVNTYNCYRSTNQGQTYASIGIIKVHGGGNPGFIGSINVFQRNSNLLYAGGDGSGADSDWPALFTSSDGGINWTDRTGTFYADLGLGAGSKPRLVRVAPMAKILA